MAARRVSSGPRFKDLRPAGAFRNSPVVTAGPVAYVSLKQIANFFFEIRQGAVMGV